MIEIIGQVVGFLALGVVIASYQVFDDRYFYILKGVTYTLMATHFLMLGAMTGASQNLIGMLRNFTYLKGYQKAAIWVSVFAFIGIGFFTVQSVIDTLPIISNVACSLVMLFFTGLVVRIVYWSGCILWLIYALEHVSYAGMINETIMFVSASVGIIRMLKECYMPERDSYIPEVTPSQDSRWP